MMRIIIVIKRESTNRGKERNKTKEKEVIPNIIAHHSKK